MCVCTCVVVVMFVPSCEYVYKIIVLSVAGKFFRFLSRISE